MPIIASTLGALFDALSLLTQTQRHLQKQFADSAPALAHQLVPYQTEGEEHVCGGVRYRIQCLSRHSNVALKDLQGLPMAITIKDDQGGQRVICGIVCQPEQLACDGSATLVQLELRDALSLLSLRKTQRVFKNLNVIQITTQVLSEHVRENPVLAAAFRFSTRDLHKIYPPRAFNMQAAESDTDFLTRLWRQEGIAWHFRFSLDDDVPTHTLVLGDHYSAYQANPAGTVRYHRADATEAKDTVVAWQSWRKLSPGGSRRSQFDYKAVHTQEADARTTLDQGRAGNQLARTLVDYQYDAAQLASDWDHSRQMGRSRIMAHEYAGKGFRGESVVRLFASGTRFTLSQHHEIDTHSPKEREFTLTSLFVYARNNVNLDARMGASLFSGWHYYAPSQEGKAPNPSDAPLYYNRFECVRSQTLITPTFYTHDVPHMGLLNAIVVGEAGKEIDVDDMGRIAVRFLFTREDEHPHGYGASNTAGDSARIRVMQPWADAGYGAAFWPRVGSEVVVAFIQNHPDKPIVLGGVYDGTHGVPQFAGRGSLPANSALSGFRSKEVQGQGHNHLRFSDFTNQIGTQIASDHGATQLNQGWLGTPHDQGHSEPRGEGFELATDAAGTIRTARAMLISAFARLRASGLQLDRQETLAVMQECMTIFTEMGSYAAQHDGLPVDTQAQADQQTKLQNWDNGSNTKPGAAGGGAPMITITAPDGLHNNTPASVVTHAGQNIDSVAVQHIQSASGGRTITNAGQGVSTFAQSGGIKTVAHQGDHVMQSQKGNTVIQSWDDLKISASGGKVQIMGATEISLAVSGGAYIKLTGGDVDIGGPGAITLNGSDHIWGGPASGSVDLPQFSHGDLGRQPVIVRSTDGATVEQAAYRILKGDGSVSQGQTNAQGQTAPLTGSAFEQFKVDFNGPTQA